jgi:hypothetical protein
MEKRIFLIFNGIPLWAVYLMTAFDIFIKKSPLHFLVFEKLVLLTSWFNIMYFIILIDILQKFLSNK